MRFEYARQFRNISYHQLQYSKKDIETLRNDLRSQEQELPRAYIRTMKRDKIIDALLANTFGAEVLVEYKCYTAECDRCKQFVEGRISADQV